MLRRLVAVVSAVMLWQVAFVAPAPVAADSPPVVDCGAGLVCAPDSGGGNGVIVPPSGPLGVTGAENDVIQDTAADPSDPSYVPPASAWGFIEAEALAYISGVHEIDRDTRINQYDRGEIRAYLIARLLSIAQKNPASRTPEEQTAYDTLQTLVHRAQLGAAQDAIDQYNLWNSDPCSYDYPAPLDTVTPTYHSTVLGPCSGAGQGQATPDPPSADQFEGIGTAMYFNKLNTLPSSSQQSLAMAMTFLGGIVGATAIGAITSALIAYIPALSALFVTGGVLEIFPFAAFGTAAVAAGGAAAGVGAFTAALGVGSAIAIAIAGLVVTAIALWQLIVNAQIPDELQDSKDSFSSPPDLGAMAQDDAGISTIGSVVTMATLPDYPGTGTPPAHSSSDGMFNDADCASTCGTPSDVSSITVTADAGDQTIYMTDGWLSLNGGYALLFNYQDWSGTQKMAGIAGSQFLLEDPNDPTKTTLTNHIDYMDGTDKREATIDPETPPTLNPTITGAAQEGETVTLNANAQPGKAGDTVSIQWLVENPFGQRFDTQILPGLSVLQGCYNGPVQATVDGLTLSCPWDKYTGDQVQYKYTVHGQWHVRVIATESNGAETSEVFEVNVQDLSPGFVADSVSAQVDGSSEGSTTLSVTGQVNDPGDDPLAVVADWGDGTSDTEFFPCDWTAVPTVSDPSPPNLCIGDALDDQLRVKPAAHPSSFSLQHTYVSHPEGDTQFHPTLLVKDDDNGWNSMALDPVTVNDVLPSVYIVCATPVPPPDGYININGCERRDGDTSYSVPLSGSFYDPGTNDGPWTMSVDWGDGNVDHYTYPCPDGDSCPFTLTPTYPGIFGDTPYVFSSLHHTYTTPGTYSIKSTVADKDGAKGSAGTTAVISAPPDVTDPTITLNTPTDGATYTVGQSVNADYTCQDDVAVATCAGTVDTGSPIDTTTLGQHTLTVSATDTSGNPATTTVHYTVRYAFSFTSPFAAPPALNQLTAGQPLSIHFSLGGDQSPPVTRGLARHARINCGNDVRLTNLSTGRLSKITYRSKTNSYYFTWNPPTSWAGKCQEIVIRMSDGTRETLLFHFNAPTTGAAPAIKQS